MSKYLITVPGTRFQGYARTEEIAQQVAAKLDKLPLGSRRRISPADRAAVITWEGDIVPRKAPKKDLQTFRGAAVSCPTCQPRPGDRCRTKTGSPAAAHVERKRLAQARGK